MKKNLFTKVTSLVLSSILVAGVATGCSSSSSSEESTTTTTTTEATSTDTAVDYPTEPIELLIPAAAGGDTDINGRIFAKYLTEELGESVVVVNMGGAGGSIGTQDVLDSEPDGTKVLWYHNSTILNEITGVSDINYGDIEIANVPLLDKTAVLVARTDSGWEDFDDMIEYAKANPDEITVGMETATLAQLAPIAIEEKMGVDFNIIDIGAAAARLTGLLGGQIDMYFVQYGSIKDYIATGEFVALCALSEERNPAYPDLPTAAEFGCDISFDKFFYFGFPKGTPEEFIDIFNQAVENVIANPDLQAEFEAFYLVPEFMDYETGLPIIQATESFYLEYQDLLK